MRKLPISPSTLFELLTADELARYPTLDHWLTRELPRAHVEGLSKEAKRHRKLAQIRACRARQKMAKAVARLDGPTMTAGGISRDVLTLEPRLIHA
jgi:hypothetical protein